MIGNLIGTAIILFMVSFVIGTGITIIKTVIERIRMRKNKSSCENKKEDENKIDPND